MTSRARALVAIARIQDLREKFVMMTPRRGGLVRVPGSSNGDITDRGIGGSS